MTISQWAIEAAIKGGWKIGSNLDTAGFDVIKWVNKNHNARIVVTLPDFWQCLGKELGWKEPITDTEDAMMYARGILLPLFRWQLNAQKLYNLILSRATDEEIAAYWEALKPNK